MGSCNSDECQRSHVAKDEEIGRLAAERDEWRQAAKTEAHLRREFNDVIGECHRLLNTAGIPHNHGSDEKLPGRIAQLLRANGQSDK